MLFNLNVPAGQGPWPLRRSVLGSRLYAEQVFFAKDPRGREYLWIGGALQPHDAIAGSDTEAYEQGVASVTPLLLDLTCSSDAPLVESLVSQFAPR